MADTVRLDNQKMLQELMANHDFASKTVVDEKLLNILMRLGNSGQQLRRCIRVSLRVPMPIRIKP